MFDLVNCEFRDTPAELVKVDRKLLAQLGEVMCEVEKQAVSLFKVIMAELRFLWI